MKKVVREAQKSPPQPVVKAQPKITPAPKTETKKDVPATATFVEKKKVIAAPPASKPTIETKKIDPVLSSKLPGTKIVTPSGGIVPPSGKLTAPGQLTLPTQPPGKIVLPLPQQPKGPLVPIPPGKLTNPATQPFPPLKTTVPGGLVKYLPPASGFKLAPPKPAAGLNLTLIKPLSPGLKYVPMPKAPPPPPKNLWVGPAFGIIPQRLTWHPGHGKKVFPYFFVGAAIGVSAYVGYHTWYAPPPSCYAGGSTVYYYPGTRTCFDFTTAADDDPFECHGRVFRWQPKRYRTVETLIGETVETSESATGWIEKLPERRTIVQANVKRAEDRAAAIQSVPIEQLDCSTCLSALGPIEGERGEATVSLVNNCDHDVTISGGLSRQNAREDEPPVCEFVGEITKGSEVAACTRQSTEFAETQIFLNAVTPVHGTAVPAPACRIPDQRAEAPPQ